MDDADASSVRNVQPTTETVGHPLIIRIQEGNPFASCRLDSSVACDLSAPIPWLNH